MAVLSLEFNLHYKCRVEDLFGLKGHDEIWRDSILSLESAREQGISDLHFENLQTLMANRVKGYFCLDSMTPISDPNNCDSRVIASLKSRGGIVGSFLAFRSLVRSKRIAKGLAVSYPLPAIQIRCGDLETELAGLSRTMQKRAEWVVFSDCDASRLLQKHSDEQILHLKINFSGSRSAKDLDDLLEISGHSQVFLLRLSHKHRVSGFGVLAMTIWMSRSPLSHILSGKFFEPYIHLARISPKLAAASLVLALVFPLRPIR